MDLAWAVAHSGWAELLEYLSAHVLGCLVPAFFIAGGISQFVAAAAVLRYLGPGSPRPVAYGVASVAGVLLAVCSCTILPLFAGIHRKGAGVGPAFTFLYAGPAINLLAIVLTARRLGWQMGTARAVGAVTFSILIGLVMAAAFARAPAPASRAAAVAGGGAAGKPGAALAAFFGLLVAILLAGTTAMPAGLRTGLLAALLAALAATLRHWFTTDEVRAWLADTWSLVRVIFPMLLVGVFIAGAVRALLPASVVSAAVGGNGPLANLGAAGFGVLMYFSTLTEVPIVSALMHLGMGNGPALTLLLAGPAVSLPALLTLGRVAGVGKTLAYAGLVLAMSALVGGTVGMWLA